MTTPITVQVLVAAPLEKVWQCWTDPASIVRWSFASDDWCSPSATNDLRVGGTFTTRMESKDGIVGFDFGGTYTAVEPNQRIDYIINGDDRKVVVTFSPEAGGVRVTEVFDPEFENPPEMQRAGWQAILENFKTYAETN